MVLLMWLLFFIIVGFSFALIARLPAIHRRVITNQNFRILLTMGLGIAAFLAVCIIMMWIIAGFEAGSLRMGYETWADWDSRRGGYGLEIEDEAQFTRDIHHEIWLQMLSFSRDCYNPDPIVCDIVSRTHHNYMSDSWSELIFYALFFASISGLSASIFTWIFTGQRNKSKHRKSPKTKVKV